MGMNIVMLSIAKNINRITAKELIGCTLKVNNTYHILVASD